MLFYFHSIFFRGIEFSQYNFPVLAILHSWRRLRIAHRVQEGSIAPRTVWWSPLLHVKPARIVPSALLPETPETTLLVTSVLKEGTVRPGAKSEYSARLERTTLPKVCSVITYLLLCMFTICDMKGPNE